MKIKEGSNLHIYAPKPIDVWCSVNHCPTCDRPRRMLAKHFDWHGTDWTCAGCGDSWQDGYRSERPFKPGWRKESIEHARVELAKIGITA